MDMGRGSGICRGSLARTSIPHRGQRDEHTVRSDESWSADWKEIEISLEYGLSISVACDT